MIEHVTGVGYDRIVFVDADMMSKNRLNFQKYPPKKMIVTPAMH